MTPIKLGPEAIEAVADEVYRNLGIRGEGAAEQPYDEFKALRDAYLQSYGIDPEGMAEWCLAEARQDMLSPTSTFSMLPMTILVQSVGPPLAMAYEAGILIGLTLASRLAEQAPEAPGT